MMPGLNARSAGIQKGREAAVVIGAESRPEARLPLPPKFRWRHGGWFTHQAKPPSAMINPGAEPQCGPAIEGC
jgi:hypothetical protein